MRASAAAPVEPLKRRGRILAIDYGRRRIGLAISDELGLTARPLATISRKNRRADIRSLRDIATRNGAQTILVGFPTHLSGQSSEMAEEVARFSARVQKELGLPVILRDERLTTWEAGEIASELGLKNAHIDSLAAAVLLREYLDGIQSKKRKQPARAPCGK